MLIKVCGLTRAQDVAACLELGIDLTGFIFHNPSPRCIKPEQAAALPRGRAMRVGVFVHQSPEEVLHIMDQGGLDLAQLHGSYSLSDCRQIGPERVIKTFWPKRHAEAVSFQHELDTYAHACRYVLLDSGISGGGHGQLTHAPWLSEVIFPCPWILAGGLGPDSALVQVLNLKPDGIDLNSGVESAPGIKDAGRIHRTLQDIKSQAQHGDKAC